MPFDLSPPEQKADVFSLESLVAWLETRDPAERYDYEDCSWCCLAQYFEAHGFAAPIMGSATWCYGEECEDRSMPAHFDAVSKGNHTGGDWTYGAALTRARSLLGAP